MGRHNEMAEVDREYHFSEGGGRGTPAATFFKRVANMAPKHEIEDASVRTVGVGHAHATHLLQPQTTKQHKRPVLPHTTSKSKSPAYFDLDDDWDASVGSPPRHTTKHVENSTDDLSESQMLENSRLARFESLLARPTVDMSALKQLAWSGIPAPLRPECWQQLLGYSPASVERREKTLAKKRAEYKASVAQVFGSELDAQMWHQISIDVPRTNPHIRLYTHPKTQKALERILYLWAIRHPASGYVQGINDLVTPFYQTFLVANANLGLQAVENLDVDAIDSTRCENAEADAYWCLNRLLDGIQDNYIHAQPGIHKQVALLQEICTRIDAELVKHILDQGVEFMQFSFRWMNCLLMREVPMACTIRMWDTYLSEGSQGFSEFHAYVCAAFLNKWAKDIKQMDFQDMMMFLQALPTQSWTEKDVELVLSEAFMWQSLFKGSSGLRSH